MGIVCDKKECEFNRDGKCNSIPEIDYNGLCKEIDTDLSGTVSKTIIIQGKKINTIEDAERAIENQKGNINDEMDMVEINAYHQGLQDALDILQRLKAGLREQLIQREREELEIIRNAENDFEFGQITGKKIELRRVLGKEK